MSTDTITKSSEAQSIATGRWRIDPARSQVEFRARTLWGRATVNGDFERYDGTLDLKRTPAIELTIDAASLNTKNGLRDRHLRSADFFDVENHPEVRFVSDSAALNGVQLTVRGRLEAAGESLPLELEATLRPVGDEYEIDARTLADHRKLGMSHGMLGMIPTPAELIVHGRLVRDADAG
ncbi:MAG TPA: YceI family protein [Solirubrobacteraceae bacterium]|nr:YceI family protein [Solirubrobacteraceae bacterium]